MRDGLRERVTAAAAAARNLLGQLGPLVWALHELHASAVGKADGIISDPDRNVNTALCVDPDGSTRANAASAIRALMEGVDPPRRPDILSSTGIRGVVNRSLVVYAAAVVEHFLDEAAAEIWHARAAGPRICPRGCSRDPEWPADTLTKVEYLRRDAGVDLRGTENYVNAGWLVLVRNAVVHNDGVARGDIARVAGRHRLRSRWGIGHDSQGREVLVWQEDHPVSRDRLVGRRFSIAIDRFILPRLVDAQAFIAEAAGALGAAV